MLAIQVGCGDAKRSDTPRRSTLPGSRTQNLTPAQKEAAAKAAAARAKALKDGTAGTATAGLDTQISEIAKGEETLQGDVRILKENLPKGSYTLTGVVTTYNYAKNDERLRVFQESTLVGNADGSQLSDAGNSKFAGAMSEGDSGRTIDIPYLLEIKDGAFPTHELIQNVGLQTRVSGNAQTGTVKIDDRLVRTPTLTEMKASVMNILNSTGASQDKKNANDKLYIAKDEAGISMYLRLLKTAQGGLRIYISFEEKMDNGTNLSQASATGTVIRNVYLTYKFSAPAAGQASQQTAGATAATTAPPALTGTPTAMTVQTN